MAEEKKKYWLHRITGGDNGWLLSYRLLREHEILSTGWSDFSTEDDLVLIREKKMCGVEKLMWDNWEIERLPNNRYCLNRFINEMQPGDIVVVPMWGGTFSICEVVDNNIYTNFTLPQEMYSKYGIDLRERYFYQGNQCIDLGFYRKVRIIDGCLDISRRDYANQDLTSRMKIRQTNALIQDIKEAVDIAIDRHHKNAPIQIKNELMEGSVESIHESINKWFDANKYEDVVEKYLYAIGADNVDTPAKNESPSDAGDADKVAIFETLKVRINVQVKKHGQNSSTGDWGVSQIVTYQKNQDKDEYTSILWLVSNANDFSSNAKQMAEGNSKVRLITGDEFARMILEVGLKHFE